MPENQYEAHRECGATWDVYGGAEEPENVECSACGATVTDLRSIGQTHASGYDVEP